MGRAGRGALWALFPAAGWLASRRAAHRRERAELVDAVRDAAAPASPEIPAALEMRARRGEVAARLRDAGLVGSKRDQARTQLAHLTAGEGMSLDDALDVVAPRQH